MFSKPKYKRVSFQSETIEEFMNRTAQSCNEFDATIVELRRKQKILYDEEITKGKKEAEAEELKDNEGLTKQEFKKRYGDKKTYRTTSFNTESVDIHKVRSAEMVKELKQEFEKFKQQIYEHLQYIEHNSRIGEYMK